MANKPVLLDRWGQPVKRKELVRTQAAATTGSVRNPLSGYPADGLDPQRLALILKEADAGNPIRQLELAETIEERDLHYLGILGTRKRSVSQLEITVEPGGDSQFDSDRAAEVETWLKRDELAEELFHILDAIGKGYSFTEIIWERSMGQWQPGCLEWRDPRWFGVARHNLQTPTMRDENGQDVPLPAFHFIHARFPAKSGLPLRSGISRIALWAWMFKAYTQRDWAIFTQTYGQPLRVGKWASGASEQDKDTLYRAVRDIAGDCAGIIPDTMSIDFVESSNLSAGSDLYIKRADWLDQQMSKAVLGQTATTDAIAGGHAVGREHRSVQEDIERADARQLEAILNRDLVQPWVQLNWGRQANYPRIKIAREEPEDLTKLANSLAVLVPLGLRVAEKDIRVKFGLPEPEASEPILAPARSNAPSAPAGAPLASEQTQFERFSANLNGAGAPGGQIPGQTTLNAENPLSGPENEADPKAAIVGRLADEAAPAIGAMAERVELMMEAAGSLEELREMILAGFDDVNASALADILGQAMVAAMAGGRAEVAKGE